MALTIGWTLSSGYKAQAYHCFATDDITHYSLLITLSLSTVEEVKAALDPNTGIQIVLPDLEARNGVSRIVTMKDAWG